MVGSGRSVAMVIRTFCAATPWAASKIVVILVVVEVIWMVDSAASKVVFGTEGGVALRDCMIELGLARPGNQIRFGFF